jgi:hypothetical protein
MVMKQVGEQLFATFLKNSKIDYRYEPSHAAKSRRPDFVVSWGDIECFFDVKDRESSAGLTITPEELQKQGVGFLLPERDPYPWIRKKIEKGRKKFGEFKGSPCALVLYAASGFASDLNSSDFMLGAMYGDVAIRTGSETGPDELVFVDNGKMFRPKSRTAQNTTISALITLRIVDVGYARRRKLRRSSLATTNWMLPQEIPAALFEQQLGVIVWENIYAVAPLPADMFVGPFDERWGMMDNRIRRTYVGAGLSEIYDEA